MGERNQRLTRTSKRTRKAGEKRLGIRGGEGEQIGSDQRRERILEVSARMFRDKGYDNTRLEDVAAELGVTRASFYYYFKSKQEILEAIYEQGIEHVERIGELFDSDLDPITKLKSVVIGIAELVGDSPGSAVFFREMHGLSPRFQRQLRQRRDAFDHRLIEFLESCAADGILHVVDPHVTAYALLGATAWMHVWFRPDGELSERQVGELIIEQFVAGLLPRKPDDGSGKRAPKRRAVRAESRAR